MKVIHNFWCTHEEAPHLSLKHIELPFLQGDVMLTAQASFVADTFNLLLDKVKGFGQL